MTAEELDQLLEQQPQRAPAPVSVKAKRSGMSPSGETALELLRGLGPRPLGALDLELQARQAKAKAERRAAVVAQREKLWGRIRHPRLAVQLRALDTPCGLLLGPSGIGKTSAARWIGARYPGCWVTARELGAAERHHPLGEGQPPLLRAAIAARYLYLDDIGTEELRDLGSIQFVIDQRYSAGRATFVTSGLTQAELSTYLGAPYVRRLVQQHVWIEQRQLPVLVVDCHLETP
jgi:hypothetical protein